MAAAALEPRAAVNWQLAPKNTLSLGYGMHHQTQPLPVFLFRTQLPDGSSVETNNNLGFTRSQHLILGYDFKPASDWRSSPCVKPHSSGVYLWTPNFPRGFSAPCSSRSDGSV